MRGEDILDRKFSEAPSSTPASGKGKHPTYKGWGGGGWQAARNFQAPNETKKENFKNGQERSMSEEDGECLEATEASWETRQSILQKEKWKLNKESILLE